MVSGVVARFGRVIRGLLSLCIHQALVGWCLFVAVGVHAFWVRFGERLGGSRALLGVMGGTEVGTFFVVTTLKVAAWRDDVTLWSQTRRDSPDVAREYFPRAALLEPHSPDRPWLLGEWLATEGQLESEKGQSTEAATLWRGLAAPVPADVHRGVALAQLQRLEAVAAGGGHGGLP